MATNQSWKVHDVFSSRIINIDELMLQAQLSRHMRSHSGRAVALAGMMAASDVTHAHLPRIVRLRLGYLSRDEHIRTRRYRRLKIALRTARTPRYFFNSTLRSIYKGWRPI
jgi:hypothetical protein